MKLKVSEWTLTRKKIRPAFSLGQFGLLFSISDRRSGPKLSEQDRRDAAYPYLLELVPGGDISGEYHLVADTEWARALSGRVWRAQRSRGGPRLVTDLTEYERLQWEDLAANTQPLLLRFEALD